jgi:hypothetical protein
MSDTHQGTTPRLGAKAEFTGDLTNVYRVQHEKANGWEVRMSRQGATHSKFFSVKRFGGVEEALDAAVRYRDQLRKLAPPKAPSATSVRLGRNDGITYSEKLHCWIAQWMECGKRKTRKFSVRKYGRIRAEQMARKARMLGVAGLAD